jgi:ribose 1,5-bisphosphokinase
LIGVLLTVDDEVLRQRLLARARETPAEIEARLARNGQFLAGTAADAAQLHLLDNSGPLQQTLDNLLRLLGASRTCA